MSVGDHEEHEEEAEHGEGQSSVSKGSRMRGALRQKLGRVGDDHHQQRGKRKSRRSLFQYGVAAAAAAGPCCKNTAVEETLLLRNRMYTAVVRRHWLSQDEAVRGWRQQAAQPGHERWLSFALQPKPTRLARKDGLASPPSSPSTHRCACCQLGRVCGGGVHCCAARTFRMLDIVSQRVYPGFKPEDNTKHPTETR